MPNVIITSGSRSWSCLPMPASNSKYCSTAASKVYIYFRRIFKFDQMDFEYAFWQMLYLLISPQKIYRIFQHRKLTKSQYARDDPAFLILFMGFLFLTSIGIAIVLNLQFTQYLKLWASLVLFDSIGSGLVIATTFWIILNRYCQPSLSYQDVEWGYAFDIHLNALFPPLVLLHCYLIFFHSGFLSYNMFIPRFFGNTFWLMSISYYIYITFLGYHSLQFLQNLHRILMGLPIAVALYLTSLLLGLNISNILLKSYKSRVAESAL